MTLYQTIIIATIISSIAIGVHYYLDHLNINCYNTLSTGPTKD